MPIISQLAEASWWPTYLPILSREQIAFMLHQMYRVEALAEQVRNGIDFYIIERDGAAGGFMGVVIHPGNGMLRIEKLYVLPQHQGAGLGKQLITFAQALAAENQLQTIELNVNRQNPAVAFYQRMGFTIVKEV